MGQIEIPLQIAPYARRDRQAVRELLFRSPFTHTHLDWHDTDDWLDGGEGVVRLAWRDEYLVGLLAVSEPLTSTAWVRLAAVQNHIDQAAVLGALWTNIQPELSELGVRRVSLLIIRDWIEPIAAQLGFEHSDDIVTLRRSSAALPDFKIPAGLTIRPTELEDLPMLARVDHAAFAPPWQLSLRELRQADRISASCTVAVRDGQIIGYQLTTLYFDGAHLARLAVLPAEQGSGIGAALVYDLLARFWRRQVHSITVNTQASNRRSQRLYTRLGFHYNGFNLPVWTAAL